MISRKKVGEYDAADQFFEGTVPEIWTEHLLSGLRRDVSFLPYSLGRVPYRRPPRHIRARHWVKYKILNTRERLALKIAPWLEEDPWA